MRGDPSWRSTPSEDLRKRLARTQIREERSEVGSWSGRPDSNRRHSAWELPDLCGELYANRTGVRGRGLRLPYLLTRHNPVDGQNSTTNRGANGMPVTLTAEMRSARYARMPPSAMFQP